MKYSKKITWILLMLVSGIWGTIAYRIYASMSANESSDMFVRVPSDNEVGNHYEKYIYTSDVRDPFRYVAPVRRDTARKQAAVKPKIVWTPPPFKLSGILMANKKKTAMLEGANGSAYFMHEGDTLSGVKIIKIKDKVVSYSYQKKRMEWVLENP